MKKLDLTGANLNDTILVGADLSESILDGCELEKAKLIQAICVKTQFRGASMQGAQIQGAYLKEANLSGANLKYSNLNGADLTGAILAGSDLESAHLEGSHLKQVDFRGAKLERAHLEGAHIYSSFVGANLESAQLQGAGLYNVRFVGTNLWGANFGGTHTSSVDFIGCRLDGSVFHGSSAIRFTVTDFPDKRLFWERSFSNSPLHETEIELKVPGSFLCSKFTASCELGYIVGLNGAEALQKFNDWKSRNEQENNINSDHARGEIYRLLSLSSHLSSARLELVPIFSDSNPNGKWKELLIEIFKDHFTLKSYIDSFRGAQFIAHGRHEAASTFFSAHILTNAMQSAGFFPGLSDRTREKILESLNGRVDGRTWEQLKDPGLAEPWGLVDYMEWHKEGGLRGAIRRAWEQKKNAR